jgi:hypothetical protein
VRAWCNANGPLTNRQTNENWVMKKGPGKCQKVFWTNYEAVSSSGCEGNAEVGWMCGYFMRQNLLDALAFKLQLLPCRQYCIKLFLLRSTDR